jgi:hypothetical protein
MEQGKAGEHEDNRMNNLQHVLHMKVLKLLYSNGGEKSHKFHNLTRTGGHDAQPAVSFHWEQILFWSLQSAVRGPLTSTTKRKT